MRQWPEATQPDQTGRQKLTNSHSPSQPLQLARAPVSTGSGSAARSLRGCSLTPGRSSGEPIGIAIWPFSAFRLRVVRVSPFPAHPFGDCRPSGSESYGFLRFPTRGSAILRIPAQCRTDSTESDTFSARASDSLHRISQGPYASARVSAQSSPPDPEHRSPNIDTPPSSAPPRRPLQVVADSVTHHSEVVQLVQVGSIMGEVPPAAISRRPPHRPASVVCPLSSGVCPHSPSPVPERPPSAPAHIGPHLAAAPSAAPYLTASGTQGFRGWLGRFGGEGASPPRGDSGATRASVASRSTRGAIAPIGTLRRFGS